MTTYSQKAAFEEGCAISLLREIGSPDAPMDALVLAYLCGVRVELTLRPGARLVGSTIHVAAKAPPLERQRRIAHELGHWCLRHYDVPDSEWGADWIGAALMLPRAVILRDARDVCGDLAALMGRHPNCSAELIRYRLAALRWQDG